jgi:dTDP-4-amino-4,6-dideoxygalactose transaminase/GT2 family glycosyltransferase
LIPLVDLAAQHAVVKDEVAVGWQDVLAGTAFIGGARVAAFEREFAEYTGTEHCVAVGNGTDAIEVALRALGVRSGDECILPANTFIATAEAVVRAGAIPVLVDCADDDTYLMDVAAAEAAVTVRTRAIIPVHLYGQVAAVEELVPIAERAGAWIVEDAAQAQGARRNGVGAGALGHAAATSFYPGKNLGAYGDAGASLTKSPDIAARMRMIRDHGAERKYEHEILGFNSRMDALQAVVLSAKLRRLERWNAARREAAARYNAMLSGHSDIVLPRTLDGNDHIWHLYVVCVPDRDRILKELNSVGIGAGIHYPIPLHLTGAFAHLGSQEGAFPVAERTARELLSLPLYAEITEKQQEQVVSALTSALRLRTERLSRCCGIGGYMSGQVDCGIIVVCYNSARHIEKLLDSLPGATQGLRTRCVVVDNGSQDGTAKIARSRNDVVAVDAGANIGYAGAINLGRAWVGPCSALLILNPDLVLEPGAVTRLWQALAQQDVGIAVPRLLSAADGSLYFSTRREPSLTRALGDALFGAHWRRRPGWLAETIQDVTAYQQPRDVAWAGGAVMLVSSACDSAVGEWDEERFFLYSEETDFAARARRAGFRIQYVPSAHARHVDGGSGRSAELASLMAVNRVRYYEKYHRRPTAALFRGVVVLHHLMRSADPTQRVIVKILLQRSRWANLPHAQPRSVRGSAPLSACPHRHDGTRNAEMTT